MHTKIIQEDKKKKRKENSIYNINLCDIKELIKDKINKFVNNYFNHFNQN